jgi:hypothetical protein
MIDHVVPRCYNRLHVEITRKKCNHTIRDDFAIFNQDAPEVPDDRRVIPNLKLRAYRHLIAASRNHLFSLVQLTGRTLWLKRTSGRKQLRVSVIGYVSCTTGLNRNILGYMSNGEIVPDVITTLLNRSNTGLIANDGSRHLLSVNFACNLLVV